VPEPAANPYAEGQNVITTLNSRDGDVRAWIREQAPIFVATYNLYSVQAIAGLVDPTRIYHIPQDDQYDAHDQFNRTTTGGLGTADVGGDWVYSQNQTTWSTSAGVAAVSFSAANSDRQINLPPSRRDHEVGFAFMGSSLITAGGLSIFAGMRRQASWNDVYRIRIQVLPASTTMIGQRVVAGTAVDIGNPITLPFTFATSTWYRIRARVRGGANPVQILGKCWPENSAEPDWYSVNDTTAAITAAGVPGFYARMGTGTTPVPYTVSLRDYYSLPIL
jgi:hypothetical protein